MGWWDKESNHVRKEIHKTFGKQGVLVKGVLIFLGILLILCAFVLINHYSLVRGHLF